MEKTQYQWYTCPGYSAHWGVAETVCDGNNSANWTSTLSGATKLLYTFASATRPAQMYMMKYLPSHKAYLTANVARTVTGSRLSFYWAPHPWGPFYPVTNSECSERDTNYPYGCVPFFALMDYGENVISTSPPKTQIRISAKNDHDPGNGQGSPGFWTVEAASGRVPFAGAARRADYMGSSGQLGMGHRFVSANESGAVSRRGSGINGTYSLDWWIDFWDHGGATTSAATSRPWFRDVISGGTKYFSPAFTDGGEGVGFAKGITLEVDCVGVMGNEYLPRIQSSFNDSTFSASSGNSSWTFISVFKITNVSNARGVMGLTGSIDYTYNPTSVDLTVSQHNTGDVCIRWGPAVNHTDFCTAGSTISANTWYFLTISAEANGSGYPTITMYLGTAGSITEFGAVNMATSGTGTTAGGLTKTCPSKCVSTPEVGSGVVDLGFLGS